MASRAQDHNRGMWKSCRTLFLAGALLFTGNLQAPAQSSERVWSCLLYASNEGKSSELPKRLRAYRKKLKKAVGLKELRVLHQGEANLDAPGDHEIKLAGDLELLLKDFSRQGDGDYLLNVQVLRADIPFLEARTRVSAGSPLFIRGLNWRDGQLIIVVEIGPGT